MIHTLKGDIDTRSVWLDGKLLNPKASQKVVNHSPDGFSWGYGGSGPAQLALAILLKITDKEEAMAEYQNFKWNIVAGLPKGDFDKEFDY